MTINSRLPATATGFALFASGCCIWVSALQMHEVFSQQGVAGQAGVRAVLLPVAILLGNLASWRLIGHMAARQGRARTFGFALGLVVVAAIYTETMSVSTSTMSLVAGQNARLIEDRQTGATYQAATRASDAATVAAERLAANLEAMPSNYITRSQEATAELRKLLDSQAQLIAVQQHASTADSATAATLRDVGDRLGVDADTVKLGWAFGIALALSLIPLSVQLALGTLSDGTLAERAARRNDSALEPRTPAPATMPRSMDDTATVTLQASTRSPGYRRRKTFQAKVAEARQAIESGTILPEIKPVAEHVKCSTRTATAVLSALVDTGKFVRDASGRITPA